MVLEGWRRVPLAQVATVQTGISKSKKRSVDEPATLPYLRVANVQDGRLDLSEIKKITIPRAKIERYRLRPGDVLLTEGGDADKLGRGTVWRGEVEDCLHQNHVFVVRTDSEVLKPEFLSALAGSPYGKDYFLGCAKRTTNLASINSTQLKEFPVLVPPLEEQRKIAAILGSVDEAIERTQAVIDQVQVVKQALMQQLLTRGLPGRHTRFKQTEFGEIPESWEFAPASDVVRECVYGLNSKLTAEPRGPAVLRMGNLQDGEILLGTLKYLPEGQSINEDLFLRSGEVLFNRTNSFELVGKIGVVRQDMEVSFASYLLRIRVDPDQASGFWLGYLLNSKSSQDRLKRLATKGVSQSNINRTKLMGLKIPVPPLSEQIEIVRVLDEIQGRARTEEAKRGALQLLKQSLMSVLLTGKLRVTP